jgi:hypothetical protein
MEDFGSVKCENHYNLAWAWALDSPFQWMKQQALKRRAMSMVFSMSGETFDVGMDTGAAVGFYPHVSRFTGEIRTVTLERMSEPSLEVVAILDDAMFRASLATQ